MFFHSLDTSEKSSHSTSPDTSKGENVDELLLLELNELPLLELELDEELELLLLLLDLELLLLLELLLEYELLLELDDELELDELDDPPVNCNTKPSLFSAALLVAVLLIHTPATVCGGIVPMLRACS